MRRLLRVTRAQLLFHAANLIVHALAAVCACPEIDRGGNAWRAHLMHHLVAALDGGEDGLEAYRHLADQAEKVLIPGGWLLVEVGIGQASDVESLFKTAGLTEISHREDYSRIPRVVMGKTRL